MTLGEKIKALRVDCNLSVEEFSTKLEISKETLENWENNTVVPEESDVAKVVALVTSIRNSKNASTEENKAEESVSNEEKTTEATETKEEIKTEEVKTTGKGAVVGTCAICNKEIHKYDQYAQYSKVFYCDECEKERRSTSKFKHLNRLVNWLTYSSYLYLAISLCTMIIYFAEGRQTAALTIVTGVMASVGFVQIIAAYIVSRQFKI